MAIGFIRGRWVNCGAPWWPSCSSVVALERTNDRLDSVECALGSSGASGVAGFTVLRTRCRRIHPGSLGSLGVRIGVIELIRVHPRSLGLLGMGTGGCRFNR